MTAMARAYRKAMDGLYLLCVIVAGIYGAISVSKRILFVQAAPAALALILLWLA